MKLFKKCMCKKCLNKRIVKIVRKKGSVAISTSTYYPDTRYYKKGHAPDVQTSEKGKEE